jgi:hypothetical protein
MAGHLGFPNKDPQELLVEGFDKSNVISTNCNFLNLPAFVVNNGFAKEVVENEIQEPVVKSTGVMVFFRNPSGCNPPLRGYPVP